MIARLTFTYFLVQEYSLFLYHFMLHVLVMMRALGTDKLARVEFL